MLEFKQMLDFYQKYLSTNSEQLIHDLQQIHSKKNLKYFAEKNVQDLSIYLYEYSYDYHDIRLFLMDSRLEEVAESIALPSKKTTESLEHPYFIPSKLYNFEINIEDSYDEDFYDEEEFYELFDKYQQQKTKMFETWFCDCWQQALQNNTQLKFIKSYFSVQDSYFYIDLSNNKQVNNDKIMEKSKSI